MIETSQREEVIQEMEMENQGTEDFRGKPHTTEGLGTENQGIATVLFVVAVIFFALLVTAYIVGKT